MRILYDHDIFSMQQYGGISRSFISFFDELAEKKDVDLFLPFFFTQNFYLLKRDYYKGLNFFQEKAFPGKTFILRKINQMTTQLAILRNKYDLYHQTFYNTNYLYPPRRKPLVITVHDMVPEIMPMDFKRPEKVHPGKRLLCEQADGIVAISYNTKADLVKYFGISQDKIEVIYHGTPKLTIKGRPSGISASHKYILFVGHREGYKNFANAALAAAAIMNKDKELHLIALGGGDFESAQLEPFKRMNCDDRVHQISAPDEDMGMYYANAEVLLYPSLYEGFGLPILEAFTCRCPVVLSNCSSFPEIADEAALYFAPLDPDTIKAALHRILYDRSLRNRMIAKGIQRARDFSKREEVKKLIDFYRRLLRS